LTLLRWILLNDCIREEHPAQISLRNLTQDDFIFQGLSKKYFSIQFLLLSNSDNDLVSDLFSQYKQNQKNCALVTFVMLNMASDTWLSALEVFTYLKQSREHPASHKSADN
jgi:hypothetical protein